MSPLTIRLMRPDETHLIRDWAGAEGWNPGRHDADCFFASDPDGFFVGEADGEIVSMISAVAYGASFGFIGLYIVRPDMRGRGFGIATWNAGMARLAGRNIALDGVMAQQQNYERTGFRFAHYHIRQRLTGGGALPTDVVPLPQIPFDETLAYDLAHFPAPRPTFLRHWITQSASTGFALQRQGRLAGFGVIRPCLEGHKIGPLFADDIAAADTLLRALLATAPDETVYLDTPDATVNPAITDLAQRFAMTEVFRTARMYTQAPPPLPIHQIFGATTLELG